MKQWEFWSFFAQKIDTTYEGQEWLPRAQKQITDKANHARSEAANQRQRTRNGTFQPVVGQSVLPVVKEEPGKQIKAAASKTNPGAVARGDKLVKERPDLAEKVRLGSIRPAVAYRQMRKDEINQKTTKFPDGKYRIIYADPPWRYNDRCSEGGIQAHGVEIHYPTMSLSELKALDIPNLAADNSVLFLWVTSPLLEDGLELCRAWSFSYKAQFIWDKIKHNMGHYNSVRHEILLVCTRGSCTPDNIKLYDSVQTIERTTHSKKPEQFRKIIDDIYRQGKRIELFARGNVPEGWVAWGNEP